MTSLSNKTIEDFELNELNKKNTFEGSEVAEFVEGTIKFGLGFWTATLDQNGAISEHPFLCLIARTQAGWKVVAKLGALWFDELNMHMATEADDLDNYMWFIGETFTNPLLAYLRENGETDIPLENWKKVLKLLASARMGGGRLELDRHL